MLRASFCGVCTVRKVASHLPAGTPRPGWHSAALGTCPGEGGEDTASPWDQEDLCNQEMLKSCKHGACEKEMVGSFHHVEGTRCRAAGLSEHHQRNAQPRRRFPVAKSSSPWIPVREAQAPLWMEERTGRV